MKISIIPLLFLALLFIPLSSSAAQLSTVAEKTVEFETDLFAADVESVRFRLIELENLVSTSSLEESVAKKFDRQFSEIKKNLSNIATTSAVINILRANTELYGLAVKNLYETEDKLQSIYELDYLSRKLKYEVLAQDWDEIQKSTAEDLYSWWDKTRLDLVDGTLRSRLDLMQKELNFAVDAKDEAKLLALSAEYQAIADTLGEAVKKTAVHRLWFNEQNYWLLGSLVTLLLIFGFWVWHRSKKIKH